MWDSGKVHREFWSRTVRERDHLEDLDVDGRMILKWILKEVEWATWTGSGSG